MNFAVLFKRPFPIYAGVVVFLLSGCQCERTESTPIATTPEIKKQIDELNQHFTYKGQPINPKAVDDMTCWLSDKFSGSVATHIRGTQDSNRYFGDVKRHEGWVETSSLPQDGIREFCGYQYVGRLMNGLHVLHTAKSGGGSGVFESLVLIKFSVEDVYEDEAGNARLGQRIVMRQVGEIALGDRTGAKLSIKGNSVIVRGSKSPPKEFTF